MNYYMEQIMSSQFREFARVFEKFQEEFPKHPMLEELRNHLSRGKFPHDGWLKSKTEKMSLLMAPAWRRSEDDQQDIAS